MIEVVVKVVWKSCLGSEVREEINIRENYCCFSLGL